MKCTISPEIPQGEDRTRVLTTLPRVLFSVLSSPSTAAEYNCLEATQSVEGPALRLPMSFQPRMAQGSALLS